MAMTLGKDVSALFPDVLKNIATGDLEQKKLVYLYLMWVSYDAEREQRERKETHVLTIGIFHLGITPNRIRTFAFSPSTPSYKTRKTPTL
jgi:hypothetical protein